jgi:hypothetical protein
MSKPLPAAGLLNWWDVHAVQASAKPSTEQPASKIIVPQLSVA